MPVTIDREFITPETASAWLERNKMNRNESSTEVARYAGEMLGETWYDIGDTIKWDTNEILADGQHRLEAIVRTNKGQHLWVARGLDPKARIAIDDGRSRKFADDLQMNMVPSSTRIESLVRKIMMWSSFQSIYASGGVGRIPRTALSETWTREQKRIMSAMEISSEHHNAPCSRPVGDFITYMLLDAAPEKLVHKFLQVLTIGSQDDTDAPLVVLRDRLTREKYEAKAMGRSTNTALAVWLMLRGWNAWVTGEKLVNYNLPRGGLRKGTPFPLPVTVEYKKEEKNAPRRA
jgi:hypothetical protein